MLAGVFAALLYFAIIAAIFGTKALVGYFRRRKTDE